MKAARPLNTFLIVPLLLIAIGLFPARPVYAATYTIGSGQTTVAFPPQFFDLIPALGAATGKISPAKTKGSLDKQNLRAIFPITAGALDSTDSRAQIGHGGGLPLLASSCVKVQFLNFSIDFGLTTATLTMTSLIVVNGNIVGRLPVFNIGTGDISSSVKGTTATWNNVPLTMTKQGADALNTIFKLPGTGGGRFYGGFPIGTLELKAKSLKNLANMWRIPVDRPRVAMGIGSALRGRAVTVRSKRDRSCRARRPWRRRPGIARNYGGCARFAASRKTAFRRPHQP